MSGRERKVVRKKKKFGLVVEFTPTIRDLAPDEDAKKKIEAEIKRAKGLTPAYLADKFNIRVSTAKKMLKEAEANNIVEVITKSRRTTVYSAASGK
jgi:small subunit ribosomal protein S25e